jgi:predicted alpha/beta hydrolase
LRELSHFPCEGAALGATLDGAGGTTALLIVTGGTEIRIGAHGGLARLAAATAAAGFPTLRFDRRGVGDSEGADPGFANSAPDIAAAARHLRALCPAVTRVIGFGLCDGATALALHGDAAGGGRPASGSTTHGLART